MRFDIKFHKKTDEEGGRHIAGHVGKYDWLLHGINEWEQFAPDSKWNWIDFHPLLIHFERDYALPGVEVSVVIVGLGVRLRINGDWDATDVGRDMKELVEAFKREDGSCPMCNGTGIVQVIKPPTGNG